MESEIVSAFILLPFFQSINAVTENADKIKYYQNIKLCFVLITKPEM